MSETICSDELQTIMGTLHSLRDWSDEVPDRLIHSTDEKMQRSKARMGWFTSTTMAVQCLEAGGYLSTEEQRTAAQAFVDKFTSVDFQERVNRAKVDFEQARIEAAEDIKAANEFLDVIMGITAEKP